MLLRPRGDQPQSRAASSSCGNGGPSCWRATPRSWASRPARWSRRAARGRCECEITLRGVRAHTARPFTGRNAIHRLAPLLLHGGGLAARARSCWTAAHTSSNCRRSPSRAAWPPTSSRTRRGSPSTTGTRRTAPGGGGGLPARAPRPAARARRRRHLGNAGRRRRGAPVARPPVAQVPGREERGGAQGEGGVDGRGVVLGARRAGGQLRPRRPAARPPSRRAGHAPQLERVREVLAALLA